MKFLMITALLASQAALASETILSKVTANSPICYGREYSVEHLKTHPAQTVQKIQAKIEHEKEYNSYWMNLEVTLKGDENAYKNYRAAFVREPDQDRWYIECDGGSVRAELNKDGKLVITNQSFLLEGGCEGGETRDLAATKGGDDVFELVALPQEFCQKTSAFP